MITLTKDGSAIKFTFDDSQHYLTGDGVIEVPVNSLALVTDESDMAVFKKACSNDIFISALYSDFGMSKSELIAWYKNNMVSSGGGGSVSGDVYTKSETDEKIAEAVSGKADTSAVTADIAAAVSGLAPYSAVTEDIDEALENYYDKDEIDAAFSSVTESEQVTATALNDLNDRADTIEQVTAIALNDLNDNKQDKLKNYKEYSESADNYVNKSATISNPSEEDSPNNFSYLTVESGEDASGNTTWSDVYMMSLYNNEDEDYTQDTQTTINSDSFVSTSSWNDGETTKMSEINVGNNGFSLSHEEDGGNYGIYGEDSQIDISAGDNTLSINGEGLTYNGEDVATENYVDAAVSGKADTSAVTSSISAAVSGKQDTLVSGTNIKTINNESLLGSGNITISGGSGGSNIVEVTQAQYEELVSGGTVDPDALYIITDASEINISDYAKSSAVTAEIAAAVSGKADTSAVTAISDALSGYVQTSAITTAVTSASTDSEIPSAKAVYDAIPTGGTGASYSAGTNISIDTGNTISCTLPLTGNTTLDSIAMARGSANATRSFAGGEGSSVGLGATNGFAYGIAASVANNTNGAAAFGFKTNATVRSSFVCGKWNDMANANTGDVFGSSGNTVFAVGNGWKQNDWTSGNATKHNALDIRQNGDIYFPDTDNTTYQNFYEKPMVRLQDMYGALGGLKFVQCTQAQYDSMVSGGTVQSDTVYFITGSNS